MRNLTIKRNKSAVGSLAKIKIYIEDPASTEITINNIPCRKIGDIKNGKEKTFQIDEAAAKIFVIADKLSKDYCNEFYQLPEGQDDIYLSGKNAFNPAAGNAFRFDGNQSQEVLENRKGGTKKGLLVLCISLAVGAVIGIVCGLLISSPLFFNRPEKPKVFSKDGMSITLTDGFEDTEIEGFNASYVSKKVVVLATKEEFSLAEGFGDFTLDEYGQLVLQNNGLPSTKIETVDGLKTFEYEADSPDSKDTYKYRAFIFKADDAFWMINFATYEEDAEEYTQDIYNWAKTISFSE